MSSATRLHAALALSRSRPCAVVGVGSSTMQGYLQTDPEAKWFTRLIRKWQPDASTVQYSPAADFTKRTTAGVHGYNAGEASTTSTNYLWSAEIAKLNALTPAAVLHMVGSNDMAEGVDPAVTKRNLTGKLAVFNPGPAHIFIHHHKRYNQTAFRYKWSDYLSRLREIEAERADVLVIDLAGEFEKHLGIPSTDPQRLMLTDKTHLNSAGHAVMADLVHTAIRNA